MNQKAVDYYEFILNNFDLDSVNVPSGLEYFQEKFFESRLKEFLCAHFPSETETIYLTVDEDFVILVIKGMEECSH